MKNNNKIISIDNEILKNAKNGINNEINKVLNALLNGDFESGKIVFSLNIEMINGLEQSLEDREDVGMVQCEEAYDKPVFKYSVKSSMKQESQIKDKYEKDARLVKDTDGFILEEVDNPQLTLSDDDEEDNDDDSEEIDDAFDDDMDDMDDDEDDDE